MAWLLVQTLYNSGLVNSKERIMYSLAFNELRVRRLFRFNGNDYIKNSSRTARMLCNGRIFYIGQADIVHPIAW